jgi:flagellar assembly protein FliH
MPTKRFTFENDFDERVVLIEPFFSTSPTFSEEELRGAKELAYQEGIEEGRQLQQEEIEAQILQVMFEFDKQVTKFIDNEAEKRQQIQVMAAKLARAVAVKICLTEAEQHAIDRVLHCLDSITKMLLVRPKMIVKVHADIVDALKVYVQTNVKEGEISIVADDTLEIYDCRFQWQEGGAEVILQSILDQIDTHISQLEE